MVITWCVQGPGQLRWWCWWWGGGGWWRWWWWGEGNDGNNDGGGDGWSMSIKMSIKKDTVPIFSSDDFTENWVVFSKFSLTGLHCGWICVDIKFRWLYATHNEGFKEDRMCPILGSMRTIGVAGNGGSGGRKGRMDQSWEVIWRIGMLVGCVYKPTHTRGGEREE